MWLERLTALLIKENSKKYLRFQEGADLNPPRNNTDKKYLLYIHIPFCEELCPYCSFNRYPFELNTVKKYFSALRQEIGLYRSLGYDCSAAYIGGGTPTILLDELGETIELTKRLYSIKEISLETNPNHLTPPNIRLLKQMGVNRLSVGVQSFNDSILKSIGRFLKYGSGKEIRERLTLAQGNFDTLNVDMIFNYPSQTLEMLESDIDTLIQLEISQATFYPLMAAQSVNAKISSGMGKISHNKEKQFYLRILEKLSGYLEPATAWCFSRHKGLIDEYIVNHDEYLGLGSGSFGFMQGAIFANTFSIQDYINNLQTGRLPVAFRKNFSQQELIRYDFLMRLFGKRLNIAELEKKYSGNFCKSLWKEILFFKAIGALERKDNFLLLTPKGLYYWVIMMREFFTGVNNFRDICRQKN